MTIDQLLYEDRQIIDTLTQRWRLNWKYIKTVVQVFTELVFSYHLFEVLVGSSDHTHIGIDDLIRAHTVKLALLQHTQQLNLHLERHIANLIEEEGTALGHFKTAFTGSKSTGKSTLFVTKELGL